MQPETGQVQILRLRGHIQERNKAVDLGQQLSTELARIAFVVQPFQTLVLKATSLGASYTV